MNGFNGNQRSTARSKVMTNWSSSWKSLSKDPPVIEIADPMSRSQHKKSLNKNNRFFESKKVITNENSLKSLSNHSKDINKSDDNKTRDTLRLRSKTSNDKELRNRKDLKDNTIEDKVNDSVNNGQKTQDMNECNTNEVNPVLSKLRKRKTDSNGCNENKSHSTATEDINGRVDAKVVNGKDDGNKQMAESDAEAMDVDSNQFCFRSDCKKKVNKFYLLDNKYCSADCAVKQWTEEFHSHWTVGAKNH